MDASTNDAIALLEEYREMNELLLKKINIIRWACKCLEPKDICVVASFIGGIEKSAQKRELDAKKRERAEKRKQKASGSVNAAGTAI